MSLFEKEEAFDFIRNFLKVKDAETRIRTDRKALLDDLCLHILSHIPFQNISLMSVPKEERKQFTQSQVKENYIQGRGGLCCDLNITTFYLLSAIGFDVVMLPSTVSSSIIFKDNHVALIVKDVLKKGDEYLVDIASGYPAFQAIDLDFETESPVYFNAFLEYKFVKLDGKILRMHRKGDFNVARGKKEHSELEFWLDDWRRFLFVDVDRPSKNYEDFKKMHGMVYTDTRVSPFHTSHRIALYPQGKGTFVVCDKLLTQNDAGEIETTVLNGDDEIKAAIRKLCPAMTDEILTKSLLHWRQTIQ